MGVHLGVLLGVHLDVLLGVVLGVLLRVLLELLLEMLLEVLSEGAFGECFTGGAFGLLWEGGFGVAFGGVLFVGFWVAQVGGIVYLVHLTPTRMSWSCQNQFSIHRVDVATFCPPLATPLSPETPASPHEKQLTFLKTLQSKALRCNTGKIDVKQLDR